MKLQIQKYCSGNRSKNGIQNYNQLPMQKEYKDGGKITLRTCGKID